MTDDPAPFDGIYSPIREQELSTVYATLAADSSATLRDKQQAMFSLIYHHDPSSALDTIIRIALHADPEWAALAIEKLDPLIQSRVFYPHPHRMNRFWRDMRKRRPEMRKAINETAALVREYCRIWERHPPKEVIFDRYPMTTGGCLKR